MANRNFSMYEYFKRCAEAHTPLLSFNGETRDDWMKWRERASKKLRELLGDFPELVEPAAEVEYSIEEDGLVRERVVFDSEDKMSVPCYILRPADMKGDGSNPAIICCHGHGAFAKDAVTGARRGEGIDENITEHNYDYGRQMAKAGFLTLSPDLRVFGERGRDSAALPPGCDPCNIQFIRGMMMGIHTLTLNIWDIKCCVDYLETRLEVDADRIGMMGLSQGGTMTTFVSAVEPRIKAADIIGYVNPWKAFAIDRSAICGSQVVPGIYRFFDTHDIAGLIAPRPLLLEMGVQDTCFFIKDMLDGYEGVKRIYEAAGAANVLYADIHPGGHAFSGRKAFEFFREHL